MPQDFEVFDEQGKVIKVGTKVGWLKDPDFGTGEVTAITDFDGDVDDETGQTIGINPTVEVTFTDGTEDSYQTTIKRHNYNSETGEEDYPDMVVSDIDSLEES